MLWGPRKVKHLSPHLVYDSHQAVAPGPFPQSVNSTLRTSAWGVLSLIYSFEMQNHFAFYPLSMGFSSSRAFLSRFLPVSLVSIWKLYLAILVGESEAHGCLTVQSTWVEAETCSKVPFLQDRLRPQRRENIF